MGGLLAKQKKQRIVMIGLDDSGKTTILHKLKFGEVVFTIPTIGFQVESVTKKNTEINAWDVGGSPKIEALFDHYLKDAVGLIFVVDSNDELRMGEDEGFDNSASLQLHHWLRKKLLKDVPFLIYANKQDLPDALSLDQVRDRLNITEQISSRIGVVGSCAVTGEGLEQGLDWLFSKIKEDTVLKG